MTTSSSPLMCQPVLFLMKLTFKLYTKCKIWGVLFAWEMGYYAMVQDICAPYCSCCAISAKLDSQTPYGSDHVISAKVDSQIAYTMLDSRVPSQHQKWDDVL